MQLSYREAQAPRKKKKTPVPSETTPVDQVDPVESELQKLVEFTGGVSSSEKLEILRTLPKDGVSNFLQENSGVVHRILASIFFSKDGFADNLLGFTDKSSGSLSFFFLEDYGVNYDSVISNFVGYTDYAYLVPHLLGYMMRQHGVDTAHDRYIFTILNAMTPEMFSQYVTLYYRGQQKKAVIELLRISWETGNALSPLPRIVELSGLSVLEIYEESVGNITDTVSGAVSLGLLKSLSSQEIKQMAISDILDTIDFLLPQGDTNFIKNVIALSKHDIGLLYKEAQSNGRVAILEFIKHNYPAESYRPPFEFNMEDQVRPFLTRDQETKWTSFITKIPASDINGTKLAVETFQDGFRVSPTSKSGEILQNLLKVQPSVEAFVELMTKLLFMPESTKLSNRRRFLGAQVEEGAKVNVPVSSAVPNVQTTEGFYGMDPEVPMQRNWYPDFEIQRLKDKLVNDGFVTNDDLVSIVTKYNGIFGAVIAQLNSRTQWTPLTLQELLAWAKAQRSAVSVTPNDLITQVFQGGGVSSFIKKTLTTKSGWRAEDLKMLVESFGLSLPVHEVGASYEYFPHSVHFVAGEPYDHKIYGDWGSPIDREDKDRAEKNMFTMVVPFLEKYPYPDEFKDLEFPDPHLKSNVVGWVMVEPHYLKVPGGSKNMWLVQELQSDLMKSGSEGYYSGRIEDVKSLLKYMAGSGGFPKEISVFGQVDNAMLQNIKEKDVLSKIQADISERLTRKLKRAPSSIEIKEFIDKIPEPELEAYMGRVRKDLARQRLYGPLQGLVDKSKSILSQGGSIETSALSTLLEPVQFPGLDDQIGENKAYNVFGIQQLIEWSDQEKVESDKWGVVFKYVRGFPKIAYKYLITVGKSLGVDEIWVPPATFIGKNWGKDATTALGYRKYYDEPAAEFGGIVEKVPRQYKGIKGNYLLGAKDLELSEVIRLKTKEIPYKLLAFRTVK